MTYTLDDAIRGARAAREFMDTHGITGAWTNAVVVDRALDRGLDVGATPQGRVRLSDGRRSYWFASGRTNLNRAMAVRAVRFREVASAYLRTRGLFAPQNAVFDAGGGPRAWQWAQALAPLTVAPSASTAPAASHAGLTGRAEFLEAFNNVATEHGRVLVEQHVTGTERRVVVVDNDVVAATRHVPTHEWAAEPTPTLKPGADAADATDDLTADEVVLIERAARAFPGLRLASFDVVLSRDGQDDQPCLKQVSANPAFARHHFPARGEARDVAGHLLDAMFPTTARPEKAR